MSLLVVGSVAYDSVSTSHGSREEALGGSATYFSVASSYFSEVNLVAVVGEDFRHTDRNTLLGHGIRLDGLETAKGKTFRWKGVYDTENVNNRETLDTQLNVFETFSPKLTDNQIKSDYLFLANIAPDLQLKVLEQMNTRPKLIALDTMNFWIDDHRSRLTDVIKEVDILFMDQDEIRSFTKVSNIFTAAKKVRELGPRIVVVKKGEHGVLVINEGDIFAAPAFPIVDVIDPTGAGDSFAGGFMGHIANSNDTSPESISRATIVGTVMGSFAVQGFSIEKIQSLNNDEIDERFRGMVGITNFSALANEESLKNFSVKQN